jgi:predicted aldo/keto reductase-like oxidoreductase
MVQQNMLDIGVEATQEGLEFAGDNGLGVAIMEPLRGGGLAYAPTPVKKVYDATDFPTRTPAEWAFRHLVDTKQVTTVVSGMSTMEQLKENIAMFSQESMVAGCLTPAERETIATARDAYKSIISIPCTGCNYCVPCPVGVQIPGIFTNYNDFRMFEHSVQPKRSYMFTIRAGGDATKCVDCGKCLKKCPQNINIPQELATAHETLKGFNE